MFTMTVDEEENLLRALNRRWIENTDKRAFDSTPGEHYQISDGLTLVCPECRKGEIVTTCTVDLYHGDSLSWKYIHQCNNCGTEFILGHLRADIRLRSPFDVLTSLETPFGTFHALVNKTEIPFRHRIVTHTLGKGYGETQFHEIDVDISGCSVGDVIHCRFEDALLEYIDSDERVVYRRGANDGHAIEVSGYDPEFNTYRGTSHGKDLEKCYPYDLYDQTSKGFDYIIERDPQAYDATTYYESQYIELVAVWVPKPYESFTFDDEALVELDDELCRYI